jgi:hypothetical protein
MIQGARPSHKSRTDHPGSGHEHYHHAKRVTVKTLMLGDDLIACVLGGVYTDVEKTMIALEKRMIVQETRPTPLRTQCIHGGVNRVAMRGMVVV